MSTQRSARNSSKCNHQHFHCSWLYRSKPRIQIHTHSPESHRMISDRLSQCEHLFSLCCQGWSYERLPVWPTIPLHHWPPSLPSLPWNPLPASVGGCSQHHSRQAQMGKKGENPSTLPSGAANTVCSLLAWCCCCSALANNIIWPSTTCSCLPGHVIRLDLKQWSLGFVVYQRRFSENSIQC